LIELGRRAGAELATSAPVIAQAWRDGARRARLARALPMVDVMVVGTDEAQRAGELLGAARSSDVVDALVALVANPGDEILTGDPADLEHLVSTRGIQVTVVRV
jgi:hypothetical protein